MLNFLVKYVLFAVSIMFTAWIIPGISIDGFLSASIACIVIALVNIFIRPLIEFISIPVNFLTLGLFSLVINALLLMLVGKLTPGFEIEGFLSALFASIVLAILAGIIEKIKLS